MTSVELKSGFTPDGDTFQLFHISKITIVMDPAHWKRRCTLIRACTLNRSNTVCVTRTYYSN